MENEFYNYEEFKQLLTKAGQLVNLAYNFQNFNVTRKCKPMEVYERFQENAQIEGEQFEVIAKELQENFLPYMTFWQHPGYFAFFPSNTSHISIVSDMLVSAFHASPFIWKASPAHVEIEIVVANWLVKLFNLPKQFLFQNGGLGHTVNNTSEGILLSIHQARLKVFKQMQIKKTDIESLKIVAYFTENSHSTIKRQLNIANIPNIRQLKVIYDDNEQNYIIDLSSFRQQLEKDLSNGFIPFWIGLTYGSTGTCALERPSQIYKILCELNLEEQVWINVDAAYAGSTFLLQEYQLPLEEFIHIQTIQINIAKLFLVGIVGSLNFISDRKLYEAEDECQLYHDKEKQIKFLDYQIGLGKRCVALKIWCVLKYFGVKKLQTQMRNKFILAKYFKQLIVQSKYFELFCGQRFSLITFTSKKSLFNSDLQVVSTFNGILQEKLDDQNNIGMTSGSEIHNFKFLRVVISNHNVTKEYLDRYFNQMCEIFEKLYSIYQK